ncbi:MAG TPA: hypothetical protein VLA33_10870 [Gemmatimonadota bacterium]|nr:hypothetical protein [Gemmatimonadota bacterium]
MTRSTSLVLLLAALQACGDGGEGAAERQAVADRATPDSAFAELQERGASAEAMGVDQYASTHVFENLADGGRIELQRDVDDPVGTDQIRAHLRLISDRFAAGDFTIPGFVHDTDQVPGTAVMAERRGAIDYEFAELPRGGEVRIRTSDPEAVRAVHEFLAFQRSDHRTGDDATH